MTVDGLDFALGATFGVFVIASFSRNFFSKEERKTGQIKNSESSFPGWEKGQFLNSGTVDYYNDSLGVFSPPMPPDPKPRDQWSEDTRAGYEESRVRDINYNAVSSRTAGYIVLQWGSAISFAIFLLVKLSH